MTPVIQLQNVSKFIKGNPIVIKMTLDVPKGSLFGLLGPNGAGKSTTIKLLTGRMKPTSGTLSILGYNPWRDRVALFKHMGYLPQNPSLPQDVKVIHFMKYMARLKGFGRSDAVHEAREKLSLVGMEKFEESIIGKLSGGEKQRLGFANSLIGDPEVMILDEPTSSLDPEGRLYVMELIAKLSRDHSRTVVVSSHILPEIQRMTNYIAIMASGRVLVSGSMRELTEGTYDDVYEIQTDRPEDLANDLRAEGLETKIEQHTLIVEVGENPQFIWKELPKLCVDKGYQLRSCKPLRDPLESVFLKFVKNGGGLL